MRIAFTLLWSFLAAVISTGSSAQTLLLCSVDLWKVDGRYKNPEYISNQSESFMFDTSAPNGKGFETSFRMWNFQHGNRCDSRRDNSNDSVSSDDSEFIGLCWGAGDNLGATHIVRVNRFTGKLNGQIPCVSCGDGSIFLIEGECERSIKKF